MIVSWSTNKLKKIGIGKRKSPKIDLISHGIIRERKFISWMTILKPLKIIELRIFLTWVNDNFPIGKILPSIWFKVGLVKDKIILKMNTMSLYQFSRVLVSSRTTQSVGWKFSVLETNKPNFPPSIKFQIRELKIFSSLWENKLRVEVRELHKSVLEIVSKWTLINWVKCIEICPTTFDKDQLLKLEEEYQELKSIQIRSY